MHWVMLGVVGVLGWPSLDLAAAGAWEDRESSAVESAASKRPRWTPRVFPAMDVNPAVLVASYVPIRLPIESWPPFAIGVRAWLFLGDVFMGDVTDTSSM